MLALGILLGIAWYFIGTMGYIYWSNKFFPEHREEWNLDDVIEMMFKALLGPINWLIGYLSYIFE